MKQSILILMTFMMISVSYGQKKETIDTLSLEDARSFNTKAYKQKAIVKVLVLPDGVILKKGETLIIGKPSNSDHDKVENTASKFTQLYGDRHGPFINDACKGGLGEGWSNAEIIIDEIILHRKRKDIIVNFTLKNGGKVCSGDYGHIVNLQKAYNRRELVSLNAPMSKDEAMEKLMEAKNLYELEVMTKEEYEALRLKLTPILKGNN
jgi:uncharacterized protein (DUF1778 family)